MIKKILEGKKVSECMRVLDSGLKRNNELYTTNAHLNKNNIIFIQGMTEMEAEKRKRYIHFDYKKKLFPFKLFFFTAFYLLITYSH